MKTQVGAFYDNDGCTFRVWAPFRKNVSLLLNDERREPMQALEGGYWEAKLNHIHPGDTYLFELDQELQRPDPASLSQPHGVHKAGVVVDRQSFSWQDQQWQGIAMEEMIIYELHVGTFTEKGTFEGIIGKLTYLQELGVNTLEIMPVAQFPGSRNWGYDGVYPYAVQDSYGGYEGLKKLVNACHQQGIAVLLDVVYNHMGPEGNYLYDYGPYFTDKYHTPWGKALNFDDAYSDQVRSFFLQNALMWMDEFHIDGLRLDAVHAIKDLGARHFLQELSEEVQQLEQRQQRKLTLIAECDLNDRRFIIPPEKGGYGLSGQWIDEFHHAIHALVTGENNGYYADFGQLSHLHKAYDKTFVYDGVYSPHRHKTFGNSVNDLPYHQFVVFAQNHDQVGNRMLGERLSQLVSFEMQKVCAAAYLLSPYVPMLFMGEEYGEEKPFQYFVSHTDPDLVEAVRKGRAKEFAYFQKRGLETPDPQSEETFGRSRLSWDLEKKNYGQMLAFYKELIRLRRELPALQEFSRECTQTFSAGERLIALRRESSGGHLVYVLMNFGKEAADFSLKEESSQNLFSLLESGDPAYGGPATTQDTTGSNSKYDNISGDEKLSLRGESMLLLSTQY
ncbi:MAG: malto-oligosyltrehalose trehalohydrolase [Cyclobacteriaceae bacterium]